MPSEIEKFGMFYPEDERVHQAIDARALKLSATAVLHKFGVWTWNRNRLLGTHPLHTQTQTHTHAFSKVYRFTSSVNKRWTNLQI